MKRLFLAFSLLIGTATAQPVFGPKDFYIVHLPDTQHYYVFGTSHWPLMSWNIGGWSPRPVYVTHVGDFTQNALPVEFQYGKWCMSLLRGIPYGVSIGNHDYDHLTWPMNWDTWTAEGMGPTNYVNVIQTPRGPLASIHLEYLPPDRALEVAFDWCEQNPTMPAMLTTHHWISSFNATRGTAGTDRGGEGPNNSEDCWRKLIETHPQIVLVTSGHGHGVQRRRDTTLLGQEVEQHLFNTQDDPYGGNGFQRVYAFIGPRMWVASMSVLYTGMGPNRTELYAVPMDLDAIRAGLESTTLHQVYADRDTFVAPCWNGGIVRGDWEWLWAAKGGCDEHGLVHFDLSGIGSVSRAVLTVTSEGYSTNGDGFSLHRMLRDWDEFDSWNTLGGLVEGVDYEAASVAEVGPHGLITHNWDLTATVRAWVQGAPNFGLLVKGKGESSGFRTREWRAKTERPRLTVVE